MNLKRKFTIIFLTISIIPILIITAFTYDRYTKLVNELATEFSNSTFEKAVIETNDTLHDIKNIAMTFNFYSENSESIIDSLSKYKENNDEYTSYDIMQSNKNISFICRNFIFSHEYINGIFIFTPSGPVLGYGTNIDIDYEYVPKGDSWYENTLKKSGSLYIDGVSTKDFILSGKSSISFSQALYDVYTHEFLGVLFIDCKPELFNLSDINALPDMSLIYIENEAGNILYTTVDDLKTNITSQNAHITKSELVLDGLSLIYSVNFQALYKEFGVTRLIILEIGVICIIVFAGISIFLSNTISGPIVHLSKKMSEQSGKTLGTSSKYLDRTDEIGILYNEYNHMVETLTEYIQKELQNKLITLDSQMKSLEAQINAHFLYNTLESINSIAEIEEIESISTMSMALGNMFRYSIKTKSELVTIEDELKHVNDYISIQTIRFDSRFKLIIDIPDDMLSLKVLKLILQPLVENALYHGLNYCQCGSYIKISSNIKNDTIYLTVSDDGKGMNTNQLNKLNSMLNEKAEFTELGQRNKQSIGIKNINTRLVLYYGEGYGLSIESTEGSETAITLKLPRIY